MKVYRIYKIETNYEWSNIADDYIPVGVDETIKYVDSLEKANDFIREHNEKNKPAEKCVRCPLLAFTKRQYNNGTHGNIIDNYICDDKDIYFEGNNTYCKNQKSMDYTEYYFEEISVE